MTQKEYALIVAGGKGTRFGSSTPKQFLELNGKPVLLHTIEAFYRYADDITVVLVLSQSDVRVWDQLARKNGFSRTVIIRPGGATRFQSVKNGLQAVPDDALVAIHDGVRPLVTPDVIKTSFTFAAKHGSGIAAVPLKESLREITANSTPETRAVDRSRFRIVQTPQTFRAHQIKKAYEVTEDESLTDDASVAEKAGVPVFLFEGNYSNLKITNREDLAVAEALLRVARGM